MLFNRFSANGISYGRPIHSDFMTDSITRLIIVANQNKPLVAGALDELRPWLEQRAVIVAEPDFNALASSRVAAQWPRADLAVVLGGDGTMLAVAEHAAEQDLAILGVNFGKLGFLAEFNLQDLQGHWDSIVSGQCRVSRRLMLEVMVFSAEAAECGMDRLDQKHQQFRAVALNDAVITAGVPFRMIDLQLAINPIASQKNETICTGDGLIIATPSGSTAYNISAGGPIVSPGIDAFCITPICPHSLAFRPIVMNADGGIRVRVLRANEGTTLVIDGRLPVKLQRNEQVFIRRHVKSLMLVNNPQLSYWQMLAKKMHWAVRPRGA